MKNGSYVGVFCRFLKKTLSTWIGFFALNTVRDDLVLYKLFFWFLLGFFYALQAALRIHKTFGAHKIRHKY
jgi:hypothetical protein